MVNNEKRKTRDEKRGTKNEERETNEPSVVDIRGLSFRYDQRGPLVLDSIELQLEKGWRCLLVGANGAGKTTLLGILSGRYMIPEEQVRVLGRPAFHDTSLARKVTFIGGPFPFKGDVPVKNILEHTPGLDPSRVRRLIECLRVDVDWHMHRVSDGQRRRVQILLKLVRPSRLLLLDEVTTDLDVVVRADLLSLLRQEAEELGVCLFYATHVFDGLDDWATHLCFLERGRIRVVAEMSAIEELRQLRAGHVSSPLYRLVERWIRTAG